MIDEQFKDDIAAIISQLRDSGHPMHIAQADRLSNAMSRLDKTGRPRLVTQLERSFSARKIFLLWVLQKHGFRANI